MENLKTELRDLGLHKVEICFAKEMDHTLFNKQPEAVKHVLHKIGLSLITHAKSGKSNWSAERIQNAALGYNDAKQMVILKSSVPSYTITAFWCEGRIFNEMNWKPLFMRTPK